MAVSRPSRSKSKNGSARKSGASGKGSASKALEKDPLVEQLESGGAAEVGAESARGFLGESPREGYWRLYLDAELSKYIEVAEQDIVHSEPLPEEDWPLGGTKIWVRRDAQFAFAQVRAESIQARFLTGPISEAHLATTGPGQIEAALAVHGTPGIMGDSHFACTATTCMCSIFCPSRIFCW